MTWVEGPLSTRFMAAFGTGGTRPAMAFGPETRRDQLRLVIITVALWTCDSICATGL